MVETKHQPDNGYGEFPSDCLKHSSQLPFPYILQNKELLLSRNIRLLVEYF